MDTDIDITTPLKSVVSNLSFLLENIKIEQLKESITLADLPQMVIDFIELPTHYFNKKYYKCNYYYY